MKKANQQTPEVMLCQLAKEYWPPTGSDEQDHISSAATSPRMCAAKHILGYTFGRLYSPKTGQARLGKRPSKKSIRRMVEKVHALTDRRTVWQ